MTDLPLAAVERIIRKAGGQRVSKSAAEELVVELEDYATEVAEEAIVLTEHAGRKTVRDVDIRLVLKEWNK